MKFRHLTINEGLSQNTVFCIFQDHKGFIWIGTEDGLNRYDGYEFLIFKHENKDSLSISNNQVNAIAEDDQGNLWIATADGLNVYNRDLQNFSRLNFGSRKQVKNSYISSLAKGKDSIMWVGTREGLKEFNTHKKQLIATYRYKIKPSEGVQNKINNIYLSTHHQLWINTGTDLKLFDIVQKEYVDLPSPIKDCHELVDNNVRVIKQDKQGNYWFGTETNGLFFYSNNFRQLKHYITANTPGLLSNVIRDIFLYSPNEIWIGTREGLCILNLNNHKIYTYQYDKYNNQSLSHNSVRNILRDKSGNIWIGTYAGGVNFFSKNGLNFFSIGEKLGRQPGLNHPVVSSILQERNNLWIGTEGGGLNCLDLKTGEFSYYLLKQRTSNGINIIKSVANDQHGNLWLGTYDGISLFNLANKTFSTLVLKSPSKDTRSRQIQALTYTKEGMYVATNGDGLYFFGFNGKRQVFKHNEKDKSSLSSNNLTSVIPDGKVIWIGTQRGLNEFSPATHQFVKFLHHDSDSLSISNSSVTCLYLDRHNRLWIGTKGGGLNLFDRTKHVFYNITSREGIANNVVHAITEDNNGNLWISTNKGISKISSNSLYPPFNYKKLEIKSYNVSDGLQSNQFSSGAVEKSDDGKLYFGGINGITYFRPSQLLSNRIKPAIELTDFYIRNKEIFAGAENSPLKKQIGQTQKITLTYDQSNISIRFVALNFVNTQENQYAYKLQGLDDEWNFVGNQHTATYTNLDPGTYIFKVKAANNDGIWNNQVRSLTIKILPPYWKTWWAYTLYAGLFILMLYLYYEYSIRTARLKNELEFEYQSHKKDQELNQQKLNFFTNISHEIKTPLTLILAPLEKLVSLNQGNNKILNQLQLIQRNGDRLIRLINQLLDFRRFESGKMHITAAEGNIVRFIREIVFAFEPYARHRGIQLMVKAGSSSIHVWFDRDKFEKIMYNLLSNALKFTPIGGIVEVEILEEDNSGLKQVIIKVKDNGTGIPANKLPYIFEEFNFYNQEGVNRDGTGIGLYFTRSLVEMHHGSISVESEIASNGKDGHTCFTIKIPMGKGHLSDAEINKDYVGSENIEAYEQMERSSGGNTSNKEVFLSVKERHGLNAPIMLVVEDNPDVLEFVSGHFSEEYEVHRATNGREGFEIALELIPDIIISDVMMPEMSGTELCTKLKSAEETSHIPVVLLTARAPLIFELEGLETGADDYITKPFSLKLLETRVSNLLELRKHLKERYSREINLQPSNVAITSPDEKFLDKVMNFIERNMDEPSLSVEELGKEIGMSRVTLYRKIKGLTNQTAIEFIRSVRLKRAAQILLQNKFQVNEVAYMVGFTDVDYFRKCFKEYFGFTPKEYVSKQQK